MSITIEVTAKCDATTEDGTKCREEAMVYEPFLNTIPRVLSNVSGHPTFIRPWGNDFNIIPRGFRCNAHSRS